MFLRKLSRSQHQTKLNMNSPILSNDDLENLKPAGAPEEAERAIAGKNAKHPGEAYWFVKDDQGTLTYCCYEDPNLQTAWQKKINSNRRNIQAHIKQNPTISTGPKAPRKPAGTKPKPINSSMGAKDGNYDFQQEIQELKKNDVHLKAKIETLKTRLELMEKTVILCTDMCKEMKTFLSLKRKDISTADEFSEDLEFIESTKGNTLDLNITDDEAKEEHEDNKPDTAISDYESEPPEIELIEKKSTPPKKKLRKYQPPKNTKK
jgi:hypothetical protein